MDKEKKKTKSELIKEAQGLADQMTYKKELIESILDDLDKKAEKKVSQEHAEGIALVEELFTEYEKIELDQLKLFEQIKKS